MITRKTVVILGAGSAPRGFPSGAGLAQKIVEQNEWKQHNQYWQWLNLVGLSHQEFEPFRMSLSQSGRESVDSFLEHRPDLIEVGKKAIAGVLIPSENLATCFLREGNWFFHLASKMNAGFEEFNENNITFVTFNYDRSLEYFLFHHLKNAYGKSEKEVADVLTQVSIIHFHGQLGKPHFADPAGRDYKPEINPEVVKKSAEDIYIVHEDVNRRSETQETHKKLAEAERILFLGFGWNETNLRRLGFPKIGENKRLEGTALGKTHTEIEVLKERFGRGFFGFAPRFDDNLAFLRDSKIFD